MHITAHSALASTGAHRVAAAAVQPIRRSRDKHADISDDGMNKKIMGEVRQARYKVQRRFSCTRNYRALYLEAFNEREMHERERERERKRERRIKTI